MNRRILYILLFFMPFISGYSSPSFAVQLNFSPPQGFHAIAPATQKKANTTTTTYAFTNSQSNQAKVNSSNIVIAFTQGLPNKLFNYESLAWQTKYITQQLERLVVSQRKFKAEIVPQIRIGRLAFTGAICHGLIRGKKVNTIMFIALDKQQQEIIQIVATGMDYNTLHQSLKSLQL